MACTILQQLDCLTSYTCMKDIFQAYPGAIYTPYVAVTIGDINITMGNKSSPAYKNHAAISSFTYGFEPGTSSFGADIEIVDSGGTAYRDIIRATTNANQRPPTTIVIRSKLRSTTDDPP